MKETRYKDKDIGLITQLIHHMNNGY